MEIKLKSCGYMRASMGTPAGVRREGRAITMIDLVVAGLMNKNIKNKLSIIINNNNKAIKK